MTLSKIILPMTMNGSPFGRRSTVKLEFVEQPKLKDELLNDCAFVSRDGDDQRCLLEHNGIGADRRACYFNRLGAEKLCDRYFSAEKWQAVIQRFIANSPNRRETR